MKAAMGLGNPGPGYEATRHNFGYMVVNEVASQHGVSWVGHLWAQVSVVDLGREKLVLAKPLTYMNRSGLAAKELVSGFALSPEDMLVIHDDADLPFGRMRLSFDGGEAGHRGIVSLVEHLGTRDFPRLRMGIGRPFKGSGMSMTQYVLSPFSPQELEQLDQKLEQAASAVHVWALEGLAKAQNAVNVRPMPGLSGTDSPYPLSIEGTHGRKEEHDNGYPTDEEV